MHGWNISHYEELDSTNLEAQRALSTHLLSSSKEVILADVQTKGKGRRGNTWLSLKGNLFATLVLSHLNDTIITDKQIHAMINFIVSRSIFDVLTKEYQVATSDILLKWPNDVYVKQAKFSGILPELKLSNDGKIEAIIIGIGINLNHSVENNHYQTISLQEIIQENIPVEQFLSCLLDYFNKYYELWQSGNKSYIIDGWKENSHNVNDILKINLHNESFYAKFMELDNTGRLVVLRQDNNEIQVITSADVFIV